MCDTKKVNVLIFPAGAETGMDIYDSLKYNRHFNVFGASGKSDHAEFIYPADKYYEGDLYINRDDFIDHFNRVLRRFAIDFVIPTHDIIAMHLTGIEDRLDARIICSPYETAVIAANKRLTYHALKEFPFYPKVYENPEEINEYPVFLKPDVGLGSKGIHLVKDKKELTYILETNSDMLISEYLPGREYTVDCFTNKAGELLFAGARSRERITAGQSFRTAKVSDNREFEAIAIKMNDLFRFRGAWFFQVKEDKLGKLKLMEFQVMQAGTTDYFTPCGVNFAALSIYDAMGQDVRILFNDYQFLLDRRFQNSYRIDYEYKDIYLKFKDVLIIADKVNSSMMKLLYQWINSGKRIILLNDEYDDLDQLFKDFKISRELFSLIVTVPEGRRTTEFIKNNGALFISSSFAERLAVREELGIPVFDADAAESLLDERVM